MGKTSLAKFLGQTPVSQNIISYIQIFLQLEKKKKETEIKNRDEKLPGKEWVLLLEPFHPYAYSNISAQSSGPCSPLRVVTGVKTCAGDLVSSKPPKGNSQEGDFPCQKTLEH